MKCYLLMQTVIIFSNLKISKKYIKATLNMFLPKISLKSLESMS